MHVTVVERDFTRTGNMKPITDKSVKKELQGRLPFYSVDTAEEAEALVALAVERGEFYRREDGVLIETTLLHEQTLENLELAGDRLAALHEELRAAES